MQYTRPFYLLACGVATGLIIATLQLDRDATLLLVGAGISLIAAIVGVAKSPGCLNVWDMQRKLMRASEQRLPRVPTLTSDGVLYVALTVEELSEVLKGQVKVILTHAAEHATDSDDQRTLVALGTVLHDYEQLLLRTSKDLRNMCASIKWLEIPLDLHEATEIFDGVTDVMVTTSGLAEAHGLPGEDGYFIVQQSNASKINPATGMIAKTPDGKWIKDPAWWPAEPRLRALLAERFYDEDEQENGCGN